MIDFSSNQALASLLDNYSAEVTAGDKKSIEAAITLMPPGSEVFIASLPTDSANRQVPVAAQLRRGGLIPVPHIVARNLKDRGALDDLLARLAAEAGVDRALVLAGDRDDAVGEYNSSLQLLESGSFNKYGIRKVSLSCYPEGHPRIALESLAEARAAKLAFAASAGLEVRLVSQFCFDSRPILSTARELRSLGVTVPLRVGVAGPASRTSLLKYAMICGVGASLRALKERPAARNMLAGDTPEDLLTEVAHALEIHPNLGIEGIHFFTFAALERTVQFVRAHS